MNSCPQWFRRLQTSGKLRIIRRRPEADGEVRLTPTEWHLLEVLLRSPGRLLSRQQILAAVWGPGYGRAAGNLRL